MCNLLRGKRETLWHFVENERNKFPNFGFQHGFPQATPGKNRESEASPK
jgi:hypothetical protein